MQALKTLLFFKIRGIIVSKYRFVSRSDFDGLACAVLLKHAKLIDEIEYVHPKEILEGDFEITQRDILANLPYTKNAHLVFDHHYYDFDSKEKERENHILKEGAPSASSVVYDYLSNEVVFPDKWKPMLDAVNKAGLGKFTLDEIENPKKWDLLNFISDARTGLGKFRVFRISNYALMEKLVELCYNNTIDEILEVEDVAERLEFYFENVDKYKSTLNKISKLEDGILKIDFRDEELVYPGNRFLKYAMFKDAKISVQAMWGLRKKNTVIAVGKSILHSVPDLNIGKILMNFGGGGHLNTGTTQVENDKVEETIEKIIGAIKCAI